MVITGHCSELDILHPSLIYALVNEYSSQAHTGVS